MFLIFCVSFVVAGVFAESSNETTILDLVDRTKPNVGTYLTETDFRNIGKKEVDLAKLGLDVLNPYKGGDVDGDIDVGHEEVRTRAKRVAINPDLRNPWPEGIVPYEISAEYGEAARALIAEAFKFYENFTCVRFIPHTDEENYVFIYPGEGCHSNVGMVGGRQMISLAEGCMNVFIIAHELMHSLGFFHEQSRPDRDEYVRINYANIKDRFVSNFMKYDPQTVTTLDEKYNYNSLMHYGKAYFSRNGFDTITPLKSGATHMGQRVALTAGDVNQVRKYYKCPSMPPYPDPDITKLIEEKYKKHQIEHCDNLYLTCVFSTPPDCSKPEIYILCPITCGKCSPEELEKGKAKVHVIEQCGSYSSFCYKSPRFDCNNLTTKIACPVTCNQCS